MKGCLTNDPGLSRALHSRQVVMTIWSYFEKILKASQKTKKILKTTKYFFPMFSYFTGKIWLGIVFICKKPTTYLEVAFADVKLQIFPFFYFCFTEIVLNPWEKRLSIWLFDPLQTTKPLVVLTMWGFSKWPKGRRQTWSIMSLSNLDYSIEVDALRIFQPNFLDQHQPCPGRTLSMISLVVSTNTTTTTKYKCNQRTFHQKLPLVLKWEE